jgi:hypothetical protein
MSSIMPIFTTPSEIFSSIFSWADKANVNAKNSVAPVAIAADPFMVASRAVVFQDASQRRLLRKC